MAGRDAEACRWVGATSEGLCHLDIRALAFSFSGPLPGGRASPRWAGLPILRLRGLVAAAPAILNLKS